MLDVRRGITVSPAARYARQGDSLSRVAAMQDLRSEQFADGLLRELSASLREGISFSAAVIRRDGGSWIVETRYQPEGTAAAFPAAGCPLPLDDATVGAALRRGSIAREHSPWLVAGAARTGTALRAIVLASADVLHPPFDARDRGYLDTLASMFAARLQQSEQLARLQFASEHDALTGLPNRATFRALGFAALREATPASVVVLDLDRFHDVNDALGHQTGDALIVEVAAALQERAPSDVVARLGGDAFGILMYGATAAVAEERVRHLIERFSEPFGTGDRAGVERVRLTASAGIASTSDDLTGFEELLARADGAMRAAKRAGGARWSSFDWAVEGRFAVARLLQHELSRGVGADEFMLHFQPQFHLASGRIVGAEALIRWNHPERGLITPDEFIPLAEQHRVLPSISRWVVRGSVAAAARFRTIDPMFRVWFNISTVELCDPGLLDAIAEHGPTLYGLGAEITENAVMHDPENALRTLAALKRAGLAIALDDFGTGRTALAQLKRLPLDAVKLDCSFTAGLPGDAHDRYIVEAVVGMGRQFGFDVVAEGIETAEQAQWLREHGCGFGQGFHLGRPMPDAELTAIVAARDAMLSHAG
jgi:diguanylate cyclase (GGDEF)-like protein